MSDNDSERQLLRRILAEDHQAAGPETPPFERVWSRAVARSSASPAGRRRGPRLRPAVAAAAVALLVAVSTISLWHESRRSRQLDRALTAAAAVSAWRAPLDFLLETPGREWLEATPGWQTGSAVTGWRLDLPEISANEPTLPDPT